MPKSPRQPLALVTGAARGIGYAITERLLDDGFRVAAIDRDPAPLRKIKTRSLIPLQCDVGVPSQVRALCEGILKTEGTPWALINNAGWGGPFHTIDEVSDDEWTQVFDTNVRSVFTFCREILPAMKKKGGRIVNIASIQGLFGAARSSTYSASKHAVIGYTRSIAVEWGAYGITCNAICPGYIDTAQGARDEHSRNFHNRVLARTPVQRTAGPAEVADWVALLVKKPEPRTKTDYLNGSIITLDGGITAGTGI